MAHRTIKWAPPKRPSRDLEKLVPGEGVKNIGIDEVGEETYQLKIDDQIILINIEDLERLHHRLSAIHRPETVQEKRARQENFLNKLKDAEDSGIQALLRSVGHNDILVLLHSSEKDDALKDKLYRNMGENSIKMYAEDLLFRFSEGVPDYLFDEAITRLIKIAESLTQDNVLNYSE